MLALARKNGGKSNLPNGALTVAISANIWAHRFFFLFLVSHFKTKTKSDYLQATLMQTKTFRGHYRAPFTKVHIYEYNYKRLDRRFLLKALESSITLSLLTDFH